MNIEKLYLNSTRSLNIINRDTEGLSFSVSLYMKPGPYIDYFNTVKNKIDSNICTQIFNTLLENEQVNQSILKHNTGFGLFCNPQKVTYLVIPPFPIEENRLHLDGFDASLLRQSQADHYTVGVILITWNSYAIGVFKEGLLTKSKIGTAYIHKEHKKGGSSQKRFARRIEGQREAYLRRVSRRLEQKLSGINIDKIYFGGNRLIYKALLNETNVLSSANSKVSDRLLTIKYANMQSLLLGYKRIEEFLFFAVYTDK